MRILNRPMFKYGGPIKEGVMHGMRNNYRSGQLVKPGPGRPGYGGSWDPRQWGLKKAGIYAASKIPSFSKGWAKRAWNKMRPTSVPKYKSTGQLYKTPFVQSQIPAWKRGLSWMKANPGWTGTGAFYGAAPAYGTAKLIKEKGPAALDYISEALVPEWSEKFLPQNWPIFNKEDKEGGDDGTKKIITETGVPGGGDQGATYIDPDKAAKLAKAAQNKRLKSYLDMMGYDRSKKTAISDALIDASALVQDATTEAGSIKNADWGKLINKAIQTTSKRLDKPEQIREAVGLMATKAAIEKDMSAEENALAKLLTTKKIEKLDDELAGNSFAENKILTSKAAPGQAGYDLAVELTKGKDFKGNLVTSTDWTEALEDMKDEPGSKGKNDQQLIKGYTEKLIAGKNYEDGHYTVGDNLVTIKDSIVIDVE